MCHQDIDWCKLLARFGFLPHEVTSLVVAFLERGARASRGQRLSSRVEPLRSECPAEAGYAQRTDVGGRAVADVVEVARLRLIRFPCRDAVEVLVVALDPKQRPRRRRIGSCTAGHV